MHHQADLKAHHILHAIPVRPRTVPPTQLDHVIWPGTGKDRKAVEPGVFFSADVYQGVDEIPRGMVKYLRVFQQDYKTYTTWNKTYRHSGPAVSIVQEEAVKRILSEVPVEADGSVYFKAPAGRTLFFQLLDEDRRCLQTMRSFTGLMPGEQRSCVGCHELHSTTPEHHVRSAALAKTPCEITPPPWGEDTVGYHRYVQPVLDQYCGQCHQGDGEARDVVAAYAFGHLHTLVDVGGGWIDTVALFQAALAARHQDQVRALGGEASHHALADAGGTAGDDGGRALQIHSWHQSSILSMIVALARPPPSHMVCIPYLPPVRSSSLLCA